MLNVKQLRDVIVACDFVGLLSTFFCSFFSTISSKSPSKRDEDSTSYSYISDSSVLSLHRLLWDHQEKIGTYLATKRLVMKIIYRNTTTLQLRNEMNKACIDFHFAIKLNDKKSRRFDLSEAIFKCE